ncbi:hypothetical protein [Neobacillus sp. YIM B06451]|uniref:hypothetical protein n=1 Tax=Neobacillus sp. YIM B06451 TaxID=3070994 RepID=UPI00292EB409|nr:hypothetical protein [Neobacillus sp. YIM B06451]
MEGNRVLNFTIDKELIQKFEMALTLNNEDSQDVFTRFMKQYVSDSFSKASEGLGIGRSETKEKSGKITDEMAHVAYTYAKKVYHGVLSRTDGKLEIARLTGMNPGSAQDYITDFLAMMEGKEYHRVMSNYGTKYFLENIKKDYGEAAYIKALEATEKHIKYYNSLGYGKLKAKEELVKKLRERIGQDNS